MSVNQPIRAATVHSVDTTVRMDELRASLVGTILMTGPDGMKAREAMIRGMFTPATPAAIQQHVLKMMLAPPESTASGAMIATFDARIECPWCGQGLDLVDAPAAVVARCDECATVVDVADPAPAQWVADGRAHVAAAA